MFGACGSEVWDLIGRHFSGRNPLRSRLLIPHSGQICWHKGVLQKNPFLLIGFWGEIRLQRLAMDFIPLLWYKTCLHTHSSFLINSTEGNFSNYSRKKNSDQKVSTKSTKDVFCFWFSPLVRSYVQYDIDVFLYIYLFLSKYATYLSYTSEVPKSVDRNIKIKWSTQ